MLTSKLPRGKTQGVYCSVILSDRSVTFGFIPTQMRMNIMRKTSLAFIAFSLFSSAFVEIGGLSGHSPVYANEASCSAVVGHATTGGAIRQQLEMMAHCNFAESLSSAEISIEHTKNLDQSQVNLRVDKTTPARSSYPAYCPPISSELEPEDFAFREALEKCRYGT